MENPATYDRKPSLSVVVIAKNEADRIGRLLASVNIAEEIVVVDSGSTDGTVEACLSAKARVVQHEWQGYAAQKQLAMDLAQGDWILSLDADEALSEASAEEILSAIGNAPQDVVGFSMPRLSFYLDRWIWHGGWYPDRKVRLVRKAHGRWEGDGIHEKLEVDGRVEKLRHPLLHYVYRGISDQVDTINRFSTVFADNYKGRRSWWYLLFGLVHAAGKFLECAFWKLGVWSGRVP